MNYNKRLSPKEVTIFADWNKSGKMSPLKTLHKFNPVRLSP